MDVVRLDSWANIASGLGTPLDARTLTTITASRELDQAEIDELYASDDIAATVVDAIPDHATRRWIEVQAEGDDECARALHDALEDLAAPERFAEWMRRNRKDGGALMIIGADDGQTPDQPLDINRVVAVRHLHVLERWQVTRGLEIESDPSKRWFGEPTTYRLNTETHGQDAGTVIHASRVFALHGIRVSDLAQRSNGGWGSSVLRRVRDPLAQFRTCWGYLGASMKRFSETWLRMKGLRELIANDKGNVVKARLAILSAMRSGLKIAPIDADDDVIELGLQLSGMSDLLLRSMDALTGAARMPLTVLFGSAPGGLSTDDVSGQRNWNHTVAQEQRRKLLVPLNHLIEILLASSDLALPQPERWQVVFCPLDEPSDKEVADVERVHAETDAIYVQSQVLDPREVRAGLRADPRQRYQLADDDDQPDGAVPPPPPQPGADAPPTVPQPTTPTAPAVGGAIPTEKVQDTALNGAQVTAALEIVGQVARRELPRPTGVSMLVAFFNIEVTRAEAIMGDVGKTFFATPEPAAAPADTTPAPPPGVG